MIQWLGVGSFYVFVIWSVKRKNWFRTVFKNLRLMLINQVPEVSVMPEAWTLYYLLDLNCKKEGLQAFK